MKFTIQGRIPSKKNSKRIVMFGKRPAIITSKDYQAWHDIAIYALRAQMASSLMPTAPHRIEITLFVATRVRGDLSNKAESLMDLMVDAGLISDDNWWIVPELILNFGGLDKVNPRAEISISHLPQLPDTKVVKIKTVKKKNEK